MSEKPILAIAMAPACGAALALLLDVHVMPGLVETVYRGESWGPLNRAISDRAAYPLEHYLSKWHTLLMEIV